MGLNPGLLWERRSGPSPAVGGGGGGGVRGVSERVFRFSELKPPRPVSPGRPVSPKPLQTAGAGPALLPKTHITLRHSVNEIMIHKPP